MEQFPHETVSLDEVGKQIPELPEFKDLSQKREAAAEQFIREDELYLTKLVINAINEEWKPNSEVILHDVCVAEEALARVTEAAAKKGWDVREVVLFDGSENSIISKFPDDEEAYNRKGPNRKEYYVIIQPLAPKVEID